MKRKMPPLINCIHVPNFRLTPQGCAKLYYTAQRLAYSSQDITLAAHEHCKNCEQGKINYKKYGKKEIKERGVEKKTCLLYEVMPYRCKSQTKDGIFYRSWHQIQAQWDKKVFCTAYCGVIYNQMIKQGRIK